MLNEEKTQYKLEPHEMDPHPRHLEKQVGPKPHEMDPHPRHLEKQVEPKPLEQEPHLKHKMINPDKFVIPTQEKLEIMINLCGDKRELINVLNHINHMFLETPEKVGSEIKVKKIK